MDVPAYAAFREILTAAVSLFDALPPYTRTAFKRSTIAETDVGMRMTIQFTGVATDPWVLDVVIGVRRIPKLQGAAMTRQAGVAYIQTSTVVDRKPRPTEVRDGWHRANLNAYGVVGNILETLMGTGMAVSPREAAEVVESRDEEITAPFVGPGPVAPDWGRPASALPERKSHSDSPPR